MANNEEVLAELRRLHAKVDAIHVRAVQTPLRHSWLKHFIKDFENNPSTQYTVHRIGTWYWLANFPIVALLFFGFPKLWVGLGLLLNTFYSLYANFATDYGAVSAALAAKAAAELTHQSASAASSSEEQNA